MSAARELGSQLSYAMGSVVFPVADENIAIGVNKFSRTCHECVQGTIGGMEGFKSFQLSHMYVYIDIRIISLR